MARHGQLEGWSSTQRRTPEGLVESVQRMRASGPLVEPTEEGARRLGRAYWLEVARAGRGLVRSDEARDGVALRLLGRGPCLLALGPAEVEVGDGGVACRYAIRGGLLARRPGGWLRFEQTDAAPAEVSATVSGFAPRFGGALYEQVQRRLHVAITRRYFRRLLRESAA